MTSTLGVIEWLQNTRTLRDITEKRDRNKTNYREMQESLNSFINLTPARAMAAYLLSYKERSREDCVVHMNKLYAKLESNLLHTYFLELAASPEAYLVLRNRFTRSLAVINTCSYLLGVGDRHLENFLLDTSVVRSNRYLI